MFVDLQCKRPYVHRGLRGGLVRARWRATAERMLVYENLASSLARLRGFHLRRVLPHEDHHHANEREGLLAKSETSRPVAHAEAGSWRRGSIQAAEAALWGAFSGCGTGCCAWGQGVSANRGTKPAK